MFISPAYAQAAGGGESGLITLLPIVLIFVVFYFLLIRPQQKKMKQHKEMVGALRRGDRVVTGGGLIGTVAKVVNENEVQVDLAENVRVKVVRHTIQDIMSKTEPAGGKPKEAANDRGGGAPQRGGFSLSKLLGGKPKSD